MLIFELRFSMEMPQQLSEPDICVPDPLMTFKILRNFGHLIPNLHISFSLFDVLDKKLKPFPNKYIESYLSEYCSETLVQLSLEMSRFEIFEDTQKPFTYLKTLHIEKCSFRDRSLTIDRLFPNLQTLKFGCNYYHTTAIEAHFPSLKYLWIHSNDLKEEKFREILKLNPQLEKSVICFTRECSQDFHTHIKKHYQNTQIYYGFITLPFLFSYSEFILRSMHHVFRDKNKIYPAHISDKYINALEMFYEKYTAYFQKSLFEDFNQKKSN